MITDREKVILDRIHNIAGQHFTDYAIFVRPAATGALSWRVSNPSWGESVAREYSETTRLKQTIRRMDNFNREQHGGD